MGKNQVEFEEFLSGLQRLRGPLSAEEVLIEKEKEAIHSLQSLPEINLQSLAELVRKYPTAVPLLASCVALSFEQLKAELCCIFGSSGWITLAKKNPTKLIESLDEAFGLVEAVRIQSEKDWTFVDVLAERRLWSQRKASSSIKTGRDIENVVEGVLKEFDVRYTMRTTFKGRANQTAPCDFAIPSGGIGAQIVGAAKGFDSTGSKLTDAVREIDAMANTRLPNQFVFAIVDGIGWMRRQSDLRRIYNLWSNRSIDGLYSLSRIDAFKSDLKGALQRLGYNL